MFRVPDDILQKLTCSLCVGYLNRSPVVIRNGLQVCARCYEILPLDEKAKCVRQLSYEAIGMCLMFPCRYHRNGCDYMTSFDNKSDHELNCDKKYFTLPHEYTTMSELKSTKSEPILKPNETMPNVISHSDPSSVPDFTYCNLESSISEQNHNGSSTVYEYIDDVTYFQSLQKNIIKCLNCSAYTDKKMTACLFGHVLCQMCQGDMCLACVKNLDGNSRVACKNASRGCRKILQLGDVGHHRDSCEYNAISCPVSNCPVKDTMDKLVGHLRKTHQNDIILNNEISTKMQHKDKTFIFLCYDGIFKCSYYYYDSYAEICVVYLGSCDKASGFTAEISSTVNTKTIRKNVDCSNWNNSMLDNSIKFSRQAISTEGRKPSFTLNIKITRK
ncbi:hypothetical protein GWI33_002788 [Rhynchophorus ferrugineus]|uniref:SIAH-type domain-containing protein n=1 Tax=Rhynchophorus ferrugineus TaxID=354439 RepID=A0A834IP52_RHYFE|nr:hypothetical protein GWI33_002788 [Rhynchophorus ferrugineus]